MIVVRILLARCRIFVFFSRSNLIFFAVNFFLSSVQEQLLHK